MNFEKKKLKSKSQIERKRKMGERREKREQEKYMKKVEHAPIVLRLLLETAQKIIKSIIKLIRKC